LAMSLPNASVDAVVCAFGLKTLDTNGVLAVAAEVNRILKPGGRYAFLEISTAKDWWLGSFYMWYLSSAIPVIGKLCLGDIECYRMLGRYTRSFGSCEKIIGAFEQARLSVRLKKHFYGCATSISGTKLSQLNLRLLKKHTTESSFTSAPHS
ncbi:MAG TPA: class I SAM-dependent methyltransferase, partial [Verrucomicrobiae bacterium]|nr:class I SAM-dependent methyltransferase [Verrucomicrobiae bacterium]